jgi:hypothetical protein
MYESRMIVDLLLLDNDLHFLDSHLGRRVPFAIRALPDLCRGILSGRLGR